MKYRNINKLLLTIYICAGSTFAVYAQTSTEAVLRQIETNNPQLKAAAAEVEAEKLTNRADALLENPEFEFNYLCSTCEIWPRTLVRCTLALLRSMTLAPPAFSLFSKDDTRVCACAR